MFATLGKFKQVLFVLTDRKHSNGPGCTGGLIQQAVGFFVIDKHLLHRIEFQGSVKLERHSAHVDDGARPVSVYFVQCEFLSVAHRFDKVGILSLWLGKIGQFLFPIGYVAHKITVNISIGSCNIGRVGFAVITTPKDNLTPIGIGSR